MSQQSIRVMARKLLCVYDLDMIYRAVKGLSLFVSERVCLWV